MKWLVVGVVAVNVAGLAVPAFSQGVKAASPTMQKQAVTGASAEEPHYITDVTGKRVRLVGPRFYTDTANAMQFPGRENAVATGASLDAASAPQK